MTDRDPVTGIWQDPCEIRLNVENSIADVTLEVISQTPDILRQTGVEFMLEIPGSNTMITGLICDLFDDVTDTFLVVFDRSDEGEPLDIERYYVAHMQLDGEEVSFYMILEPRDMITSSYNRRMTHTVRLYCHDRVSNTLPIPTTFSLETPEGEKVTTGTVTEYFRTQSLIKKIAKENRTMEKINWY